MRSFFPSHILNTPKSEAGIVPKCGACKLFANGCRSPKMKVSGKGGKGIYIIGEAPGEDEDERGIQFVGRSGRELQSALSRHGIDMREDCWLDNALVCRPKGNVIPKKDEDKLISYCQPHLITNIRERKPHLILTFGKVAIKGLVKNFLMEDKGSTWQMAKWAGLEIPCQKLNAWICPNYHPSFLLREREHNKEASKVTDLYFNRFLREALKHKTRPWKQVPDFLSMVECIADTNDAVRAIRSFRHDKLIAFDYETTSLKPDNEKVRQIVCCSISNGKRTICYPWNRETRNATCKILENGDIKKVGANVKFEDSWTWTAEGIRVRGWFWDIVNSQHILDCRRGITSVKFQGFAELGQADWSHLIKPYLEAATGNDSNRIQQVNKMDLWIYCGIDSLIEYLRAVQQVELAGLPLPEGAYTGWKKFLN